MEFLEEESKPKFLFQSRPSQSNQEKDQKPNALLKPSLFISLSLSLILLILSLVYTQPEPIKSLLIWVSLSLLVGPFAPSSLTAGDIHVGRGKLLLPLPPLTESQSQDEKPNNRRSKTRKFVESEQNPVQLGQNPVQKSVELKEKVSNRESSSGVRVSPEEREWSDGDLDLLKKLMAKNPVGTPRRWEAITEGFGGAHGVDSVIKTAKSMGERKAGDSDSFARFLKDRKAVDKRVEEEIEAESGMKWSSGEDIALLNALKAFPKEAAMRWEKVAAAVPGKTKAACVKRVAELKKDFRSSKGGSNEA